MDKRPTRSVSHKGEKVCSYTVDFKLEVVKYAEQSSIHAAGRKYNVSRSSVRDWKKKKIQLEDLRNSSGSGAHRRRLSGGGRKVFDSCTERSLIEWIGERKRQGLTISGALIIKKAKSLQQEKLQKEEAENQIEQGQHNINTSFDTTTATPQKKSSTCNKLTYSRGWLEKFMNRNGLVLKNFPTYKSPMMSPPHNSHIKMECDEHTPTVIPLDDMMQDHRTYNISELREDGDVSPPPLPPPPPPHSRPSPHSPMRHSISLTKTINQIHEMKSLNNRANVANNFHKSRHVHTQFIESSHKPRYEKVRHVRSPTFIGLDERYDRRSPKPHKFHIRETYSGHHEPISSCSNLYSRSRLDDVYPYTTSHTKYHVTRVPDDYPRYTMPTKSLYKSRTEDTYIYVKEEPIFHHHHHKNRGNSGDFASYDYPPSITTHKARYHDSRPYSSTNKSYHKCPTDESYTYTSPNTTFLKSRLEGSTYATSNSYKTRDMQNPIVIPLDDILPE